MILNWIQIHSTYIFLFGYIIVIGFWLDGKQISYGDGWMLGGIIFCLYAIDALNDNLNLRAEILKEMKETLDKMKDKLDAE